jgi:MerR family transcriptional regulator/heat shock protein HspR
LYEDGGLIRPARKNNRRFYTTHDLQWIGCVRYLLHEKGLNQEGLRRLLARIPCWEIAGCSEKTKAGCEACEDRSTPCWDLARRADAETNRCYECAVYLTAMEYVLNSQEREEALKYAMAG